jgi:non-specific serine/threonine protein kinase
MVERFNGEDYAPFMVLSLKVGGVGLNLTPANHVIHFDRWWNPSVENQATDRAFRIGQKKNVLVHKFITAGTIEEKIDAMIESKQKIAGDVIASSGETWITELDDNELAKLFRLEVKA